MHKERYEWVQSWCDEADEKGKRLLLIGDSITRGYEGFVRNRLRNICRVDYLSCSYAVDSLIFHELISSFVKDSEYDVIHFNHGLHGLHMDVKTYADGLKKLFDCWQTNAELILATTTFVYRADDGKPNEEVNSIVEARNAALRTLAAERGCPLNDLYSVSVKMDRAKRSPDGVHFEIAGYEELAERVTESVLKMF